MRGAAKGDERRWYYRLGPSCPSVRPSCPSVRRSAPVRHALTRTASCRNSGAKSAPLGQTSVSNSG